MAVYGVWLPFWPTLHTHSPHVHVHLFIQEHLLGSASFFTMNVHTLVPQANCTTPHSPHVHVYLLCQEHR
jgi:hypothetical protein